MASNKLEVSDFDFDKLYSYLVKIPFLGVFIFIGLVCVLDSIKVFNKFITRINDFK
jgi:hypothetical protein